MSKTPKPIIHNRDHEHGGADTVRIHYESVGGSGGGGGGAPQAVYELACPSAPSGVLEYFHWSYAAGDEELLDLTDDIAPTTLSDGVYAYTFNLGTTVLNTTGTTAWYQGWAVGSSGFQNGCTAWPVKYAGISNLIGSFSFTVHQAEGGIVYATVTSGIYEEFAVTRDSDPDFGGSCFVQKVT